MSLGELDLDRLQLPLSCAVREHRDALLALFSDICWRNQGTLLEQDHKFATLSMRQSRPPAK